MAIQFQGRRLSVFRLLIVLLVIAGLVAGSLALWFRAKDRAAAAGSDQWFGAYVDSTSTPFYDIGGTVAQGERVVLGFIVADPDEACAPSWGGFYSMDEAADTFDLDRKVARVKDSGGEVVISTGGLLNDELASACQDEGKITSAYKSLLERYESTTLDLDIEADDLTNVAGGKRRAAAVAQLQQQIQVEVWLTLPAATFGLAPEGLAEVNRMLDAGVDLAGVNLMTMNFGQTRQEGDSMAQASIQAAESARGQLSAAYREHGQQLGEQSLWRKIGVTPMIGQNDLLGEVFDLQDAKDLNDFVKEKGLGRVSFWSANRDYSCGDNFPDPTRVSNNCSGVTQEDRQFAKLLSDGLGHGVDSAPAPEAAPSPEPAPVETAITDDPATSPYPIWNESAAYVEGDRTVWRKNVYEAKWWTQGTAPDAPAAEGQPSPWQLVGPVLPGDKPAPVVTAPKGLYPEWAADAVYTKGDRVLFEGRVMQAKWWNSAQSPQAALEGAAESPWDVLDNATVQKLIQEQGTKEQEPKKQEKGQESATPSASASASK